MAYEPGTLRLHGEETYEKLEELREQLQRELDAIAREFSETTALELRPRHAEPKKPRDGMIVYADGTDWDPGTGEGVYAYENGSWEKL